MRQKETIAARIRDASHALPLGALLLGSSSPCRLSRSTYIVLSFAYRVIRAGDFREPGVVLQWAHRITKKDEGMPELRRLAAVAANPDRLAEFYREVFELADIGAAHGSAFLSDGGFNLALLAANGGEPKGLSYIGFQMARLESIEKKLALVHYTGRIAEPNRDADIEYEIQDPDGNRIGLCKRAFDTSYEPRPMPVRHIALFTADPQRLANFYVIVFGMKVVDRTDRSSIFVSDGYINLALLYQRSEEKLGLNHFGFHVRSNEAMRARAERAGALGSGKRPDRIPVAEYRVHDPEGNGFDISEKGWKC